MISLVSGDVKSAYSAGLIMSVSVSAPVPRKESTTMAKSPKQAQFLPRSAPGAFRSQLREASEAGTIDQMRNHIRIRS